MKYKRISICILFATIALHCKKQEEVKISKLFVGTYTNTTSEGVYSYQFNMQTGMLSGKKLEAKLPSPSFVKISPNKKFLYAVQETDDFDSLSGGVSAFEIQTGGLIALNSLASKGAHPCHISISKDGSEIAVSNYTGGNLSIFQLDTLGSLKPTPQVIEHSVLDSTKTAHMHSSVFKNTELFAADLGLDGVKRYQKTTVGYVPFVQNSIDLQTGSGPRHFVFSADGKFLYVINEYSSTITVFQENTKGEFLKIATKSTLAPSFKGDSYCADIHLSADGKFLYGSNRGENSIVVFKVEPNTGELNYIETVSVEGDWPRNFTLDPSGRFLLVANQKSDNITVFSRDIATGKLKYMHKVSMVRPVCLEFL